MSKTREISKGTILGTVIILAIIATALAFWLSSGTDDSHNDTFKAGYYERSYEALEETWDNSRVDLVRTALYISTCDSANESRCNMLKTERDRLVDSRMPERVEDGDDRAYERAASRANNLITTINNTIDDNDHYIQEIHDSGIDDDLAELIGVTVREAQSSRSSLYLARLELIADPENETIRQAKEQLEAAYAEYETKDLPSGWGMSDVETALKKLEDARKVLDEALFFD